MKSFDIREDIPKSKKHLNYEMLDLKSKRIFNRLFKYLFDHKMELIDFLKELLIV